MTSKPVRTCTDEITLVRRETNGYGPAKITEHGDITLEENYREEVIDVHESSLYCATHGRLGIADYEAHGISEEWEEV